MTRALDAALDKQTVEASAKATAPGLPLRLFAKLTGAA
jgi:hypothetical protein